MVDFGYVWDNKDVVAYSTRHMPRPLLRRLKQLAASMDQSVEWVVNQALDVGLTVMERRGR